MKITPITKDNLEYFKNFLSSEDEKFIKEDLKILPLGLVADDAESGENSAAGAICLRPDDFMLNITSLFVAPSYRKKGGGRFLLDETKRIFGEKDMEFNTEFLIYGKDEEDLALFLEDYGFVSADPEYDVYITSVGELETTKLNGKKGQGCAFSKFDTKILNSSEIEAATNGAMLPSKGFISPNIDTEVSAGIINEGTLEAFIIFEKLSEDLLLLSALYARDKSPVTLLHLLEKSTNLLQNTYPDDTRILIQSVDETGENLIESIFENANDISCRYRYVI